MEQQLHTVTLDKLDTCLTYCLRRIGLDRELCHYETYNEYFHQIPWNGRKKNLVVGSILLWDREIKWKWMPSHIDTTGRIENRLIPTGFHFAVYEGDGLISDTTRIHSIQPPSPSIRLRRLQHINKNPDWILQYDPNWAQQTDK